MRMLLVSLLMLIGVSAYAQQPDLVRVYAIRDTVNHELILELIDRRTIVRSNDVVFGFFRRLTANSDTEKYTGSVSLGIAIRCSERNSVIFLGRKYDALDRMIDNFELSDIRAATWTHINPTSIMFVRYNLLCGKMS